MTEAQNQRAIADVFPPMEGLDQDKAGDLFANSLKQVISESVDGDKQQQYLNAVDVWRHHPDHGAPHGYATQRGMKSILTHDPKMKTACETAGVSNSMIECVAMVHDFGQQSGIASPSRDARTDHARRIGVIARYIGDRVYHFDKVPLALVVDALVNHDAILEGRPVDVSRNPLLALLSDADKLYGAKVTENPKELMVGLLERNLTGSKGETGWYFFRDDLTAVDRLTWAYGSRWRLDGFSAVLNETNRVQFFTNHAREMAQLRNAHFLEAVGQVYGGELKTIHNWLDEHQSEWQITKVGKNVPVSSLETISTLDDLRLKVQEVKDEPITGVGNREGAYRGVKLKLEAADSALVIDPGLFEFLFDNEKTYDPDNACQRLVDTIELSQHEYLDELVKIGE